MTTRRSVLAVASVWLATRNKTTAHATTTDSECKCDATGTSSSDWFIELLQDPLFYEGGYWYYERDEVGQFQRHEVCPPRRSTFRYLSTYVVITNTTRDPMISTPQESLLLEDAGGNRYLPDLGVVRTAYLTDDYADDHKRWNPNEPRVQRIGYFVDSSVVPAAIVSPDDTIHLKITNVVPNTDSCL